jgi:hypothetical protein
MFFFFLCSDYAAVIMVQIMKEVAGTAKTTTTFLPQIYFLRGKENKTENTN